MDKLPNLLVISETIPQTIYAGSILLYRLLKDYPTEKLLVIGVETHADAKLLGSRYERLKLPLKRLDRTRFSRLLRSLRAFNLVPQLTVNSIKYALKEFKPDVVLSVMQVQPYYHLAYRYARAQKIPLILLIHDIPEAFEIPYNWAVQRQIVRNAEVYRYASKRLCVSPEMRDYLEKVYGVRGDVLYPNRSEDLTPCPVSESTNLKQPGVLIVGYAGTLAYGYGVQLEHMIPAFQKTATKLRIYSRECSLLAAPDAITYCGYAPPEETWLKVKQECDAVILPYCWSSDSHQQDLYKTHFPSKLPEYLALGMPVLIIGPEYATGVKWGLQNPEAALVVTENHPEAWAEALNHLKASASLRETMSQQALIAGARDFAPGMIRNQLFHHLREALFSI